MPNCRRQAFAAYSRRSCIKKAICTAFCLAAATACNPTHSQNTIPEAVSCPHCVVVAESTVTVGDLDGPGIFGRNPWYVAGDARGRLLVYADKLPQVFDSTGAFIGVIGAPGQGPGEFGGTAFPIPLPGDSLLLLEQASGRMSVFTPDLRFARGIGIAGNLVDAQIIRWPDSIMGVGLMQARQHFGRPLHLLSFQDRDASILLSGGSNGDFRPDFQVPHLARGPGGELWTAERDQYQLTRWSTELEPVQTIRRVPSWWVESEFGPFEPPPSSIASMIVGPDGLLWVFILVPGKQWKDAWPKGMTNEIPGRLIAYDKLFATVVEVIDPTNLKVVARARFENNFIAGLAGPTAVVYTPTEAGEPQMQIWNLVLRGR